MNVRSEEVGADFHVSRECVRQLQNNALLKLRRALQKSEELQRHQEAFGAAL